MKGMQRRQESSDVDKKNRRQSTEWGDSME
jgi:hypothetical protein